MNYALILIYIILTSSISNGLDTSNERTLTRIEPNSYVVSDVTGIPSGGLPLKIHGSHLDGTESSSIYISYNDQRFEGPCHVESSTILRCTTPKISTENSFDALEPTKVDVGFLLDGTEYENFSMYIYPDPKYWEFEYENKIKNYRSDYLTIEGENLDKACKDIDIKVQVGTSECDVTSISRAQLTCRPPRTQPSGIGADGEPDSNELPEVIVKVGENLSFTIGYLSYESREK